MNYSSESSKREKKKRKNPKKRFINKFLIITFRIILGIFLVACFVLAGALLGAYIGIINDAPSISTWSVQPSKYNTELLLDGTDIVYDKFNSEENREYVTLGNISQHAINAIVAVEDERFYKHNGVDLQGMVRALYVMVRSGFGRTEGASTLTQQLIKNTVPKVTEGKWKVKFQEQFLALKYEKALEEEFGNKQDAKNHIVEVYLNTVSFYAASGIETASQYYFDKSAKDLTASESAVIVAITNSPTKYDPISNAENNNERKEKILKSMLEQRYISDLEYTEAMEDNVYDRLVGSLYSFRDNEDGLKANVHPYYAEAVFNQVVKDLAIKEGVSEKEAMYMVYNSGYKIYVPIDPEIQRVVDEAYNNNEMFPASAFRIDVVYELSLKNEITGEDEHFRKKVEVKTEEEIDYHVQIWQEELIGPNHTKIADKITKVPQPQSAMVIMDYYTGYVKAIAGARGEKDSNMLLNRATQSKRQPGSVFKVVSAFAPGIDSGKLSPASVIDDVPFTSGGYSPDNHWGSTYRGLTSIRQAIVTSANVATVKALDQIGIETSMNYLSNFGFDLITDPSLPKNDLNYSMSLGGLTYGVTQTEVAAAYGAIANLGYYNKAKFYTQVVDRNGKVVLNADEEEPKQVLKEANAYILTDMMKGVVSGNMPGATGTRAKFINSTMPIAGKTGTTSKSIDLTFVGYTPYYLGSIWLGYDDGSTSMQGVTRQNEHLVMWRYIMEQIHENLEVKNFPRPDNVLEINVCRDSGLLPSQYCSSDPRGGRVTTELFMSGAQPVDYCDVHVANEVCTLSGRIPNSYCPSQLVSYKVGIKRRVPYTGSASVADRAYEIYVSGGAVCDIHSATNSSYIPEPEEDTVDIPTVETTMGSESTTTENNNGGGSVAQSGSGSGNNVAVTVTTGPESSEPFIPEPSDAD